MNPFYERSILGAIEGHELLGDFDISGKLKEEYDSYKNNQFQQKENEMMIQKNQVFEGTLVAAGWDKLDRVNQSSLYTQSDEDILLEHALGMKKFKPFLNQKVRISGDVISTARDGRRVSVKKISRLIGGFTKPKSSLRDEYNNLSTTVAA